MDVILGTWEAEVWRIVVQDDLWIKVHETPSPKQLDQKRLEVS
jgi:hypothetical protein